MPSPSAWTAKAHGVTMSLSSGFGGRSNTRRYISEPTTRCPRPGLPSADTSASTTAEDHIRALTGRRPIRPTSPRCRMSRRLNPGRSSTYQTEEAVQTSGASSVNLAVTGRGVLAAAIGMVSEAGRRLLPLDGHGQGCDGQFCPHVVTHRPADDFAGEEIEHDGQIEPPFLGWHVGDVGEPNLI